MVRAILTRLGHDVSEAACGETGLAALESQPPDAVILDLLMPGVTGYKVLEKLRELHSAIPRIVLTADIQDASKKRCLDLGATCVLSKPPNSAELEKALELALAAPEHRR